MFVNGSSAAIAEEDIHSLILSSTYVTLHTVALLFAFLTRERKIRISQ